MSFRRPEPDEGSTLFMLLAMLLMVTAFGIAKSGALNVTERAVQARGCTVTP